MIGLCQEGKSSPEALGRSAGVELFGLQRVYRPRGQGSSRWRTRLALAVSKISEWSWSSRLGLCFPASLEANRWEHPELALLCPVGLKARPGRLRVEAILLVRRST